MPRTSENILQDAKIVAVVGASPRRERESNKILRYLKNVGYTVIPINPLTEFVEGIESFPDLESVPEELIIDIVNIFRRPEHVEAIVKSAHNRSEKLDHPNPAIWTQLGVSSDAGLKLAEVFDMEYIRNRCILVVHSMGTTS